MRLLRSYAILALAALVPAPASAAPAPALSGSPAAAESAAPAAAPAPAPAASSAAPPSAVAAPLLPTGPQLGERAPDFTLHTLAGKTVTLDSYKGQTLVLNAWATWCPPCREEMPDYISVAPKLAKGDVAILGVDTTESEPIVRAYAASKAVPYSLAVTTDDAFAAAYDVQNFPTTFVIDPQGVLRARIVDVVTAAQLTSYAQAAKAGRNVVIVSALQQKIDAKLGDPSIAFDNDPASVEANANKAIAAIAAAEQMLDSSDSAKGDSVDFVRTRAQEAALRDRAIAALVNVGTSVGDHTLLTRMRAAAALDGERWRDAADSYAAVLALAPSDKDALDGLSSASYQLQDYAAAADAQSKLVALDPNDVGYVVSLARYQAKAGKKDDANATFARAIATAQAQVAAEPRNALRLRMLAYAHLYAGRAASTDGDGIAARVHFDQVVAVATKLPASDSRHDMYLEEAQEAIVALGLGAQGGFSVSLAPWTGADLPGSIASTFKYRLAVAGDAGRNVSLVASGMPKHWVASFCSDNACAPSRTSFELPPSGIKVVEFQLVPPVAHAPLPKIRVTGNDGKREASATT